MNSHKITPKFNLSAFRVCVFYTIYILNGTRRERGERNTERERWGAMLERRRWIWSRDSRGTFSGVLCGIVIPTIAVLTPVSNGIMYVHTRWKRPRLPHSHRELYDSMRIGWGEWICAAPWQSVITRYISYTNWIHVGYHTYSILAYICPARYARVICGPKHDRAQFKKKRERTRVMELEVQLCPTSPYVYFFNGIQWRTVGLVSFVHAQSKNSAKYFTIHNHYIFTT